MHYEIYEFIKRSAKQWILEWSVGYNLLGPLNPNCGGGVGLFIDKKYKDYEILSDESVFEPHLYESIWVKIKMKSGRDKITGYVYRPNTAPLANLDKAIEIYNQIIDKIQSNKKHAILMTTC